MSVDLCFNELHGSDLFHPAMMVKPGMQHFTFTEIHRHMEDQTMPEERNHVTKFVVGRFDFIKAGSFFLVPVLNAEIRVVIKLYTKLPAVELDNKSPTVKKWVFSAVWCMSDEKIMVKPHI